MCDDINEVFLLLNECIDNRYRKKGYKVAFALYKDKEIYGVSKKDNDLVIYTDVTFSEATINNDGEYRYPDENYLLNQLGEINELLIGGFHASDCVKRVGEMALKRGISTLVDLDLTDFFFHLYRHDDYIDINKYSVDKYKNHFIESYHREDKEFAIKRLEKNFSSPIYGFVKTNDKRK